MMECWWCGVCLPGITLCWRVLDKHHIHTMHHKNNGGYRYTAWWIDNHYKYNYDLISSCWLEKRGHLGSIIIIETLLKRVPIMMMLPRWYWVLLEQSYHPFKFELSIHSWWSLIKELRGSRSLNGCSSMIISFPIDILVQNYHFSKWRYNRFELSPEIINLL